MSWYETKVYLKNILSPFSLGMSFLSSVVVRLPISLYAICALSLASPIQLEQYLRLRENAIKAEESSFFGGDVVLEGDEIDANSCLMSAKLKEINEGYTNLSRYLPSRSFLSARQDIERSKVFKIIRLMPKGAVLHAHVQSMSSFDWIFREVINMPNLYVCSENSTVRFRFFEVPDNDCDWQAMTKLRATDPEFPMRIMESLSLPDAPSAPVYHSDLGWEQFGKMLTFLHGPTTHRPVFEKYLPYALQQLYDDNIMYVEFRGPFFYDQIYELNGTVLDPLAAFNMFKNIVDEFVKSHPGFIGAKFVHSLNRRLNRTEFDERADAYLEMKRHFPDFIIGFDVDFYEDMGHPLVYFAEKLLEMSRESSFYFHAGETNWFGHPVDQNLFDAILLNTKRIGHGYPLLKHPHLLKMVKEKNIVIEVSPISSQALGYFGDMRNHPAGYFFAHDYPVIVSNDAGSYWGSSGLSYDFYEAFMGIMSLNSDLRALKKLAMNSIEYSALVKDEKEEAFRLWEQSWIKFVKYLAHEYDCE